MTSLSDAERDACDAMQALAGLAALLRRPAADVPGLDPADPAADDVRRLLLGLAEDGGEAAGRVLAYLRELRGAGDGDLAAVPARLGPWREWVPPRGHLFGLAPARPAPNEVPQPRRSDPGE
ncbi:hypothetical protein [Actinoplanes sp. URMC 104]|uniref:hypothetical protein n=1 Tax=Actinoplanes sp. URMC 104 TaxID=3423409 RepID=UPI003F1A7220